MSCKNRLDLSETKVRNVMTRDVVTIRPDENIHRALEIMQEQRVAALPVVNFAGNCLGIVSRTDLSELFLQLDEQTEQLADEPLAALGGLSDGYRTRVSELMTAEPQVAKAEERLVVAAQRMSADGLHHLPVVDEEGLLVGILSSLDFVSAVAQLAGTSACRCSTTTHAIG